MTQPTSKRLLTEANAAATYATAASVAATYRAFVQDMATIPAQATDLIGHGTIFGASDYNGGGFDARYVESPMVWINPADGQTVMTYTAWARNDANANNYGDGSIGLTVLKDGINWEGRYQWFTKSGVSGAPDEHGVTGGVPIFDDAGNLHLFYIGLTAIGYEAGTKTICHATAPSPSGPWTRHGSVISPSGTGWRSTAVWRPNFVRRGALWYCFFNATGSTGKERCGYATATSLDGPWTVHDSDAPLLPNFDSTGSPTDHTADGIWGGDPFVYRDGDHWRMEFSNADSGYNAVGDWFATTSDAAFPLGWSVGGQSTSFAKGEPFKPTIVLRDGIVWHYGTNGGIALATSRPLSQNKAIAAAVSSNTTAGNSVAPSGGWTLVPELAITVYAKAGEWLELTLTYIAHDEANDLRGVAFPIVNGSQGTAVAPGNGVMQWGTIGPNWQITSGTFLYRVQAADISSSGAVVLQPAFLGWRTVENNTTNPITFTARRV